jgi:hypothetical protein
MGFPGAVAFALFFLFMLKLISSLRVSSEWNAPALSVAVLLIVSMASDTIGDWLGGNLFWVFIGLLGAMLRPMPTLLPSNGGCFST